MARNQGEVDKNNVRETVVRSLIAAMLHFVVAGLAIALIIYLTSHFTDASGELRRSVNDAQDPAAVIDAYLGEARSNLIGWVVGAMVGSWIAASWFLGLAQRHDPRDDDEASKSFPAWCGLFLVNIVLTGTLWWQRVSLRDVAASLFSTNYTAAVAAGIVSVLLAYYISTALIVKYSVKRSVPGAVALPSIRK